MSRPVTGYESRVVSAWMTIICLIYGKNMGNHWYKSPPVVLSMATRGQYFTKGHPLNNLDFSLSRQNFKIGKTVLLYL